MITAVDSNILLDVLIPHAADADAAEHALTEAIRAGALVLSEPVYAELAALFRERSDLEGFLSETGIRLEASSAESLHEAGRAWREYTDRRPAQMVCPQCGTRQSVACRRCSRILTPRQHIVSDFIIGAHASSRQTSS